MRFEVPVLLWLSPVIAIIVGLIARFAQQRRRRMADTWSREVGNLARAGGRASLPLLTGAALMAAVGVSGPRGGRIERLAEERGLNVMLAVDISRSMLAEDAEPNRLQHAVSEARRLLQDLSGDRVGVVAFAGASYVLTPLTLDHSAAGMFLEAMDPDLASSGGTEIAGVFTRAQDVLGPSLEGGDRVLVLFTDGEAHDSMSRSLEAARALARSGVRVVIVPQGKTEPVRIPIRSPNGELIEYKRDDEGRIVETRREDDVIRAIASAVEATVIPADLPDQAGAVRDALKALARRPIRERRLSDLEPLGWIAALVAVLLLLAQTGSRRTAALVGLGACCLVPSLQAQRTTTGQKLVESGRLVEAVSAFREAALRGEGGDTAWFNVGAAALAAGQLNEAQAALVQAARTLDPGLRFRALYNLGLTHLLVARSDTNQRAAREAEAGRLLKEALLLNPGSAEAKWNLELTLRDRPPSSGGSAPQPPPTGGEQQPEQAPPSDGLTPSEAEALLASVERGELATRTRLNRQQRLRSATGKKDW